MSRNRVSRAACVETLEGRLLLAVTTFPEYRGANAQHQFGGNSDEMVSWNVNLVRETVQLFDKAPLGYGSIQQGSSWYHGLQGVVDRNRQNGITTILCPFGWNGSAMLGQIPTKASYWPEFNARLYAMAEQFKDQPDVWLEFWNEPYAWDKPTDINQWTFDMEVMIGTVRSAGAMNKIVVPGGMMGGDETVVLAAGEDLLEFDPQHDLVFDIHAYNAWFDGGPGGMDARMQRMADSRLDFIFGEFGAVTPGGVYDVAPFIQVLQKHRYSGLAWMWRGGDGNQLLNNDNSLNSTAANMYWGQKAKDYITGAATVLPQRWATSNIGNAFPAATGSYSGGVYRVAGAGADIWGTSDQFGFTFQEVTGGQIITAQVATQQNTDLWAKAGLMIRASSAANAPFVAIELTPANGLQLQARASAGAAATSLAGVPASTGVWVRLVRSGNTGTAYYATTLGMPSDADWRQLGAPQTLVFNSDAGYLAGVAVTSHNVGSLSAATFTGVSIVSTVGLAADWKSADIGSPSVVGSGSYAASVYSVRGGGTDIGGSADQFHYTSTVAEDDATIIARVGSLQNSDPWAKAGIMLRDSESASAAYVAVLLTPGNGLQLQARKGSGAQSVTLANAVMAAPAWLKLRRIGSDFVAWYSTAANPSSADWTVLGSVSGVSFTSGYWYRAGLAVSSHSASASCLATFSGVQILASTGLPLGWTNQDIGAVNAAGSAGHDGSAMFSRGSGIDIWNTADAFNFSSTSISGDAALMTRVTSLRTTNGWAKAGPMFRTSSAAGAAYVALERTPSNGIHLQMRTGQEAIAVDVASVANDAPAWLKLTRVGAQFTAYYAITTWQPANAEWKLLATVSNSAFGVNAYMGGLALTSASATALGVATFANTALISAPKVTSFVVDDGTAQRSMVRHLTISFSQPVSLTGTPISLAVRSTGQVAMTLTDISGDGSAYRITFPSGNSLADGMYTLTLSAAGIRGPADLGLDGGNATLRFHCLFGDTDGDRDVDRLDYTRFKSAFRKPASATSWGSVFDADGSGVIDLADWTRFRKSYQHRQL